ncbi:5'-nucleotidase C-terminal domain-containing protein [uncultured Muriicola sp.]|uniref:5'-nucleotidase C-terminal domain-containing protein n=1 Tax=uncultured Muriicola sp. TaxID=1583102 RepID=UPI00262AC231|nr:5'-nucleotidase [uncultured Muriicola sp.]
MKHFVVFITIVLFTSCAQSPSQLTSIKGAQLPINSEIPSNDSIEVFITPYRNRINTVLDSVLAYAPKDIVKTDGKLNTSEGNLMADILMRQSQPIFKLRTGHEVDIALLNYGGIRNVISAGSVTSRTAFEVMPFENYIVVLELPGTAIREMVSYLIASGRPQPFSGMKIVLNNDGKLQSVNIQGKPFDENKTYYLATIDYLLQGGGNMDFLKENKSITELDYLLRNAMIDYFIKVDTLEATVDDRFIQIKHP